LSGFPQGSVIGPSLANFTLNGLEDVIKVSQRTRFSEEKYQYWLGKGFDFKPGNSNVRKSLISTIVRFADDFIIVTNDKMEAELILKNIKEFLSIRGLKLNDTKTEILE